jgi:predicted ATPase
MKILCKNFGPLKEFSIDLDSDFVLIVGENNIGKSYAISLLYAILKTLTASESGAMPYFSEVFLDEFFTRLADKDLEASRTDFIKSYKSSTARDINITELAQSLTKAVVRIMFVDRLEKTISGTFGDISNLENRRSSEETFICITTTTLSVELKIKNNKFIVSNVSIPAKIVYRKSKQRRSYKEAGSEKILYGPEDDAEQAQQIFVLDSFRTFSHFAQEVSSTISDVHYLPASRSGLYQALSAFGQIIAELSKRRTFLSQRIELPAISEPLVDYFLKLNEIAATRKPTESTFLAVAEDLEKKVLGGAVDFDSKSKKLFYRPFGVKDLKLDLSTTSSMVSEVAPIVTYLKHVLPESEKRRNARRYSHQRQFENIKRKQIIFIEEPEAHLHPRTQVLLMDAFARLVKDSNVKMIMTSHSNFVFNKISNLVIAKSFGESKIAAFRFVRQETGTVSESLEVDRLGITDENFGEISEDLFYEKMEMIDAIESDGEASE